MISVLLRSRLKPVVLVRVDGGRLSLEAVTPDGAVFDLLDLPAVKDASLWDPTRRVRGREELGPDKLVGGAVILLGVYLARSR